MTAERFSILVVDDNPADRLLYRLSLQSNNESRFETDEAALGERGIEACKTKNPDCIVLDYNLPDMDGVEFMSAIKNEVGKLPCAVVMLTGVQDERVAVQAMKSGATDYIPKTDKVSEVLEQSITGAIEKFRMRRKIEEQQTALEASERKYRALMENTPQLVWLASSDREIIFANRRWSAYTGISDFSRTKGDLDRAVFGDDREGFREAWQLGIERNSEFEIEVRLGRASDECARWHFISVVPIQDFPDAGPVWLGTCTDIENNKQAERAIQQMQKWESIGVLAGGIAHDFNNLLTGILGNASFVVEILPAVHPAQPMLDAIVQSSERAAILTRQMLAYSGKAPFFATRIQLSPVVRQTCELVRASIPANVRLALSTKETLPLVETDPGQLQQVIVSLLINAAEAIPEGQSGTIGVRTFSLALPDGVAAGHEVNAGNYVVLEVQDSGIGINEEIKSKIFDPFFTTKFTGRGLGLAAAQGIVRSSRGWISVDSTSGAGSTFRVFLPAVRHVAGPEHADVVIDGPRRRDTETILVIDDEDVIRNLARLALERSGYRVLLADGGEAGLRILKQEGHAVSLILLDMGMPGMGGREVLTRLRSSGITTPVVVCSGYSEPDVLRNFAGCEFTGFIQKPFTIKDLPERIGKMLQNAARIELGPQATAISQQH